MSETKWTPGPWAIDDNNNILAGDDCVADPWGFDVGEEQYVANANLIAAAPDLYAACEAMLNDPCDVDECPHDDYQSCPAEMARLAMAKARGVS